MSEKDYITKSLTYCEHAFKFLITSFIGILIYLFFNSGNLDKFNLILLITLELILFIGLFFDAIIIKRFLGKLRRLN